MATKQPRRAAPEPHDLLWAPWRMGYLKGLKKARQSGKPLPCFLCAAIGGKGRGKEDSLVVERSGRAFCILNKYPYHNGHLMIVPNRHTADFISLAPEELAAMDELTQAYVRVLGKIFKPEGFNIGINLGRAAGAGLETHLHLHIVPRWMADTNFLNVLGKTRVVSLALQDLRRRLRRARGLA